MHAVDAPYEGDRCSARENQTADAASYRTISRAQELMMSGMLFSVSNSSSTDEQCN